MINEEKAAIMLLSLDEDIAAGVMKNLRPSEIKRIGKYMNRITTIPSETMSTVAKEFIILAKEKGGSLSVGDDSIKNIITKALGEKSAQEMLLEVANNKSSDNPITDKLRDMDPKILMEFTKTEHPQTIAMILAHMSPEQAATHAGRVFRSHADRNCEKDVYYQKCASRVLRRCSKNSRKGAYNGKQF